MDAERSKGMHHSFFLRHGKGVFTALCSNGEPVRKKKKAGMVFGRVQIRDN